MGLQIPRGICSEIQIEEIVRKVSEKSRGYISAFMPAAWSRTLGRAFNAGPCAYVLKDSAYGTGFRIINV